MEALEYLKKKFKLDYDQKMPIELPTVFREDMAKILNDLNFNVGAEVGTWRGTHAELLCENMPNLKLYCIDPWEHYSGYRDYHTSDYQPAYEEAMERTKGYNVVIKRMYSMDAVKDFADKSLDFVYIDANHDFRHCIEDIDSWEKKVKKGGIVFGHDYKRSSPARWLTNQVYYAVSSYLYANKVRPWFVLGENNVELENGNGVKAWMYVRT